jgi:hypothetical protein
MGLKPETAWRRIVMDTRLPVKCRVEALGQFRPSLHLLRQLLSDTRTPTKLRIAAARQYSLEIARRELMKNEK